MNQIQVATITHNGRPFYTFATPHHAGDAAFIAGRATDALTDTRGDGFDYQVTAVDYVRSGPAGDGDALRIHGAADDALNASDIQVNPSPTQALSVRGDDAAYIADALEVGSEDGTPGHGVIYNLIAAIRAHADGGTVVIQVQP